MLQTHSRCAYDTSLKHLYRKGLEAAIPFHLGIAIPRSNVSRWRAEAKSKYLGHDLNNIAVSELAFLQTFAANKTAKQVFRAWCRIGQFHSEDSELDYFDSAFSQHPRPNAS